MDRNEVKVRRDKLPEELAQEFLPLKTKLNKRGLPMEISWEAALYILEEINQSGSLLSHSPPPRSQGSSPTTLAAPGSTPVSLISSKQLREEVIWVYLNMDNLNPDYTGVSDGAKAMLRIMQEDKQLRKDFFSGTLKTLLPDKKELNQMKRYEDDGRDVIKLIDRCQTARDNAVLRATGS